MRRRMVFMVIIKRMMMMMEIVTCVRASSPPTSLEQAPHIGRNSGSKDFTVPDVHIYVYDICVV